MKRSLGRVSVEVLIVDNDTFWWESLSKEQRNSIRDRVDAICDDLTEWVPK